jgi:carbamate kinase
MIMRRTREWIAALSQHFVTSRSFTDVRTRSPPVTFVLGQRLFSSTATTSSSTNTDKQHIVVALGGNALLERGQDMTTENQQDNISSCMASLKGIVRDYKITLVHGNGPQVGLLVLESASYEKETGLKPMHLDVLDAETEGMIGYLIEQEMQTYVGPERGMATILSQIVVDKEDPAFQNPTKFIGPIYTEKQAAELDFPVKRDGDHWRRVVPSPLPVRMVENQMKAVRLLTDNNCIVICAGGGGIPVVQDEQTGKLKGVEAVIDKDRAACMMGISLEANGLLILTDVAGVAKDYNTGQERWIKVVSPDTLVACKEDFPAGSMGPKVESAIEFVKKTGGWAAIGSLNEADKVIAGTAGTRIEERNEKDYIEFHLS